MGAAVAAMLAAGTQLLATALPAAAHASLVDVTPTAGTVVQTPPPAIRIGFDEPVQVTEGSASVTGPDGEPIVGAKPKSDATDGSVLLIELPAGMPDGTYHVSWRVISLDTHAVQGIFDFAVGRPSSPLTQTTSTAAIGPSVLGGAGRAAAVAGALTVAGFTAFPLRVLIGPPSVCRR